MSHRWIRERLQITKWSQYAAKCKSRLSENAVSAFDRSQGPIELSSRVNQLREAGIAFDMKCRELEQLYQAAIDDLRKGYSDRIDEINSEGGIP